jgi:hypothetical protein
MDAMVYKCDQANRLNEKSIIRKETAKEKKGTAAVEAASSPKKLQESPKPTVPSSRTLRSSPAATRVPVVPTDPSTRDPSSALDPLGRRARVQKLQYGASPKK